jgi:hypothetical protein
MLTPGRVALLAPAPAGAGGQDITPTGATVTVTAGTVTFGESITPTGPTVSITAGTPAIGLTVAPTGPTVSVTAGTVTFGETVTPTGPTVTVTAGTVTVAGDGEIAPTGPTVSITAGSVVVASTPRITVSGRKLLKGADVFHMKAASSWCMTQHLSNADITAYLEAMQALGFNCITFTPCGFDLSGAEGYSPFENPTSGDDFFTGSPVTSTLGAAWANHVVHALDEMLRLDMYAIFSLYTGFNNTDGIGAEMISAGTSACFTYGQRVAAVVGAYPNLILHYGADHSFDHPSDPATHVDAWFEGFFDGAGRDDFVIVAEQAEGRTTYDQFGLRGDTPYTYMTPDVNAEYDHSASSVEVFEAAWGETGATTYPVWDVEPAYIDSVRSSSADVQEIREQIYAEAVEGGCGINFGHEAICTFGGDTGFVDDPVWDDHLADVEMVEAGYAWAIVDEWTLDTTYGPDSTWITTGVGSGDTKAGAGKSDSVLLAYFPSSRTLTIDTTVFTGTGNVRLRWYDPTAGTYSTIAASEAQNASRSISSFPSNHADGFSDWVLVVDSSDAQAVTPTGPTVSVTPGTPSIARTITPTGPTVSVTAGIPAIGLNVTPTGATVTITPGTVTVVSGLAVVPDGPTVTVTPGTPSIAQAITLTGPTVSVTAGSVLFGTVLVLAGPTVTVTAGTVTVAGDGEIAPTGPTVTVTPGTLIVTVAALTVPVTHVYTVPAESRTYIVKAESRNG